MAQTVECSPMIWETWVQSQVASYQRLLKWYMIPPCLTLSNIRYVSRVKWSNPGKGLALSSTPRCSSYWKGSLLVALDCGRQIYLFNGNQKYSDPESSPNRNTQSNYRPITYLPLRKSWRHMRGKRRTTSFKAAVCFLKNRKDATKVLEIRNDQHILEEVKTKRKKI